MKKSIVEYISAIAHALGFLTRLTLPQSLFVTPNPLANTVAVFPFAGALIGVLGFIVLSLTALLGLSSVVCSILTILALIILTGALHEDGLADSADALFVNKSSEERLVIMKDSRTGVFGVIALAFSILLRITFLNELIISHDTFTAGLALVAVESFSRSAMVLLWGNLPLARKDGTLSNAGLPSKNDIKLSFIIGLIVFILLVILGFGFFSWIVPLLLFVIIYYYVRTLAANKIGGLTGDILGAAQQLFLIAVFLGIVLVR